MPAAPIADVQVNGRSVTISWVQEPIELDNYVDGYFIIVATMPIRCVADVAPVTSILDASEREFMIGDLEEFSEISINIIARNLVGEASSSMTTETPSAGKY